MEKKMPPVSMSGESAIRVIDWMTNRGMSVEEWVAKAAKRKWYNGEAIWTVYKFGEARYIIDALINA